jgi:hypothetical protein
MSYEIPLPMPEQLARKPILHATQVHKYLEDKGFHPIAVVVDNTNAKIKVFFEQELDETEKKKLYETVIDFYKRWVGVEEQ